MKQLFESNLLFPLLVIVMCFGLTVMSYGQAIVHIVFPQTEPLTVGEQIIMNVQIADGQNISGYELTVGFDPTALRYVKSTNADYLPVSVFVIPPIITNEEVHLIATSKAGAASENEGTLATLTFEVIEIKDSTIKLIDVILSDSAGVPLAVATRNGRIGTIQLPSIGDVNEDRKVNILDLTLVASNLMAANPSHPRVDVNEDGIVNILDLVLVGQHLDAIGGNRIPEIRVIPVNSEVNLEESAVAARPPIDFDAEKAAIQELYSAFYEAFNDNDIGAIGETFDT
ncbi:MAG: cohesin domain-containing protein, partial [Candidatus Poribacteria bacterium]|nr:cohesin domain-containing protein [Candidatus Poribacteria bacterium]